MEGYVVTYTIDELWSADDVRSSPLRLVRGLALREYQYTVLARLLGLPRQTITTLRDSCASLHESLNHQLICCIGCSHLNSLEYMSEVVSGEVTWHDAPVAR